MKKKLTIDEAMAMVPRHIVLNPSGYKRQDDDVPLEVRDLQGEINHIMLRPVTVEVRTATAKTIMFLDSLPSIKMLSSPDLYFAKWCLTIATGRTE